MAHANEPLGLPLCISRESHPQRVQAAQLRRSRHHPTGYLLSLHAIARSAPFARPSAKLIFWSPDKPPVQRVDIDVENENAVKQINKAGEISGATAEEGDRVALISDRGFDFVY